MRDVEAIRAALGELRASLAVINEPAVRQVDYCLQHIDGFQFTLERVIHGATTPPQRGIPAA